MVRGLHCAFQKIGSVESFFWWGLCSFRLEFSPLLSTVTWRSSRQPFFLFVCLFLVNLFTYLFIETLVKKQSMPTSVYKSIILLSVLEFPLVTSVVLLTGKPPYWHDLPRRARRSLSYGAHSWAPCCYCNENDARRWVEELFTTLKNFLVFEKCVSKIQKTQDVYKFRRKITEITLSINSRVRLWKINHSGPGCSFYEFYEWYIFQ